MMDDKKEYSAAETVALATMNLHARIRQCVNCDHQYIPKRQDSEDCPGCHNPWNIKVVQRRKRKVGA